MGNFGNFQFSQQQELELFLMHNSTNSLNILYIKSSTYYLQTVELRIKHQINEGIQS